MYFVSDWRLSMEKWSGTNLTILVFIYPTCFQEFGMQVSLVQGVPASIGQGYKINFHFLLNNTAFS